MISSTYTGQIYGTDATSTTSTTSTTSSDSDTYALGQDAFLTMFMAQVTNQNPLDPMDNTEFTAQLATFSQLEQLEGPEQEALAAELAKDPLFAEPGAGIGQARLAFGPFLALATLAYLFVGPALIDEYLLLTWP